MGPPPTGVGDANRTGMQITCPNCDTSYTLPADKIGPGGRQVRCARCGTRWHAEPIEDLRAFEAPPPPPSARVAARGAASAAAVAVAVPAGIPASPSPAAAVAKATDPDDEEAAWAREAADTAFGAREAEPTPEEPPSADAADDWARALADDPEPEPPAAPVADPSPAMKAGAEGGGEPAGAPTGGGDGTDATEPPPSAEAKPTGAVEKPARPVKIRVKPKQGPKLGLPRVDWRAFWARTRPFVGLTIFLLGVTLPVLAILMRQSVVQASPAMAGLYRTLGFEVNLRGLVFEKVETLRELDAGQPVLVVEGVITNVTDDTRPVPSIRLALRAEDQQEIYAWSVDPKVAFVAPGGSLRFRTRLASPPDQARDVQIRFTDRRSRQATAP